MSGRERGGGVIEVNRRVLLNMLRRIEEIERKLNEIEIKFAQRER
ncbi:MAG: hypothetical protein QXT30_05200 [Candidatus Bathyarchaeia archaeon]